MFDYNVYITEEAKKNAWLTIFHHSVAGSGQTRKEIHSRYLRWKGHRLVKMTGDLVLYQMAIWENKPDYIVETGTKYGGSALFFADMMELTGKGQVISVDIVKRDDFPTHSRLRHVTGSSTDKGLFSEIEREVQGKKVMVVLDSDHRRMHVKSELHLYHRLVPKGQFMVIEDVYDLAGNIAGPGQARNWFLGQRRGWYVSDFDKKFISVLSRDGWLMRSGR